MCWQDLLNAKIFAAEASSKILQYSPTLCTVGPISRLAKYDWYQHYHTWESGLNVLILRLMWRCPMIDSDACASRLMRVMLDDPQRLALYDQCGQWPTLTHVLYEWCGHCMIGMDAHILRSIWLMPNDRFWRSHFPIDAATAWWSTFTHALCDQYDWGLMIDMDAHILQSMWPMPKSILTLALCDWFGWCPMVNTDAHALWSMWHIAQCNNTTLCNATHYTTHFNST
jgi:hypothetical protein